MTRRPYSALMDAALAARDAGDLEGAIAHLTRAAALEPANAEPHHHLGVLFERDGRLAAAEAAFRRALDLAPNAEGTRRLLGILLLSLGRLPEGFAASEARHALDGMAKPDLPWPEWRGEDLTGKRLLIWPEQGFGDQIMFARFAPLLQAQGAEVTLLCAKLLERLFAQSLGVRVVAASGETSFPDPDYWVMACSLAGRMGLELDQVPGAPYLRATGPAPALPAGCKVGVAVRGNPANMNDARRSLPEAAAARLRALPAQVIDLDPSATGARDFADTADIVAGLDLVIAVDTAIAHLAGALGKPVWILLPQPRTDWRWLRGRSDSPWYPSARLFRQPSPGDWDAVLDAVTDAFAATSGTRARR